MSQLERMTLPGLTPQWTLGDYLRKAREVAGLSQTEMAEAIGIARNSVGRYESGVYVPSRPVLIAWALRTGVALDWINEGLPRVDSNHQPADWLTGSGPPSAADLTAAAKDFPELRQLRHLMRGRQVAS